MFDNLKKKAFNKLLKNKKFGGAISSLNRLCMDCRVNMVEVLKKERKNKDQADIIQKIKDVLCDDCRSKIK